jgi:hypothetical protein
MVLADVPETAVQQMAQLAVPGADVNGPHVSAPEFQFWLGLAALAAVTAIVWRA